ncbi:hypothetical protein [Sagittula sp. MA-2]|uniref:hypothetical protein n=1 Tax=Sagittula sp. MA-2 TaxID=3048007 RepID=UPI0024C42E01|nr:hypothetical protein [Sagittula sp. MA-2]WHZ35776.1 hypothetical protein QNI11_01940 [Sagittula sp. MA-2]
MFYFARWHTANILIKIAFFIAPRGAARDRLLKALVDESLKIIHDVDLHRAAERAK